MAPPRRPSMGRQKIEIRRIQSEEARQVCFSKRRAGLFKKASELSTLCGAQVAAVVFSPAGKAFSFGHPSVEDILDRLFGSTAHDAAVGGAGGGGGGGGGGSGGDWSALAELNRHCGELCARQDDQKAEKERVEQRMATGRAENSRVAAWIEADAREMPVNDLAAFGSALMELNLAVKERADQVLRDALAAGTLRSRAPPPLAGAGFDAGQLGAPVGIFQFGGGVLELDVGQSSGSASASASAFTPAAASASASGPAGGGVQGFF